MNHTWYGSLFHAPVGLPDISNTITLFGIIRKSVVWAVLNDPSVSISGIVVVINFAYERSWLKL